MKIKANTRLHNCMLSCLNGRHHPSWMPSSLGRLEVAGVVESYTSPRSFGWGEAAQSYRLTAMGKRALAALKDNAEIETDNFVDI